MTEIVNFTIPGNPLAKGRPRFARKSVSVVVYTDKKTASYENLVKLAAMGSMKGKELIAGPVRLAITLSFQIPDSWAIAKKLKARNGAIRPTVKPDLDNCCKLVADALNGVVWHDDKQVVEVVVKKFYSDRPRANVSITELS